MADMWSAWQSDVERLTPFADEWKEGRVEDFIRHLLNSAAKKRQQRDVLLTLMEEVKNLQVTYKRLLTFFDLEQACRSWSPENCSEAEVERVSAALAEWRAQLLQHSPAFPPPETDTRTFADMQTRMLEAQAAAAMMRPSFAVLDAALSSGAPERESADTPAPSAEPATTLTPTVPEEVVVSAPPAAE